jgi:hypothetical protein
MAGSTRGTLLTQVNVRFSLEAARVSPTLSPTYATRIVRSMGAQNAKSPTTTKPRTATAADESPV